MSEFASYLFDGTGFVPRWQCGAWTPALGALHIASDLLIWLAYLAIPVVLVGFVRRRADVPFSRLFWLFGAFILTCGTTHLIEAVIFYRPVYPLAGAVKLLTALISWATVLALFTVIPAALAMRTPAESDRLIAARTAELEAANLELLNANRELAAANRELETFCYSVSHDLRTPLRALDGFSQELLQSYADRLDDQGRHYLTRVRAGTQRMGQLIDDLLKLSRVTRVEMRREPVDLTALAESVVAELHEREPGRSVSFTARPGLAAECDPTLVRGVLENLLGNAWKFTAKNPAAAVAFDLEEVGGRAAFVVRDDGAGFDMAFADKLFGAFQRLHSDREFPGTGIGLATVQRVVRRHGGEVWAEGAVGRGAAFYFTLPGPGGHS